MYNPLKEGYDHEESISVCAEQPESATQPSPFLVDEII